MNKPLISVVIPTYKDWDRLKSCIDALNTQSLALSNFEIIIINNDPDDSCPFSTQDTNIKILSEYKSGSYAARNTGINAAKSELIAFTDSDCIPDKYWLERSIDILKSRTNTILAGEIDLFASNTNIYFHYERVLGFPIKKYVSKKNFGVTANLIVPKEVISAIGPFNVSLKSGGDTEFCRRAVKNGFKLRYSPEIRIKHPARSDFHTLKQKARRIGGNIPKNKNTFYVFLLILVKFRLPISDILYVFHRKELSNNQKWKIILIRIAIKYTSAIEAVKVFFGKNPNRS